MQSRRRLTPDLPAGFDDEFQVSFLVIFADEVANTTRTLIIRTLRFFMTRSFSVPGLFRAGI